MSRFFEKLYSGEGGKYIDYEIDGKVYNAKTGKVSNVKTGLKKAKDVIKANPKATKGVAIGATVTAAGTATALGIRRALKKKEEKKYSLILTEEDIRMFSELQERLYAEEEEKKGSGLGKKLAIGAATVGTTAAALWAGKKGYLGTGIQRNIGKGQAWMGNKVGSQSMINSGAKTMGNAQRTDFINMAKNAGMDMSGSAVKRGAIMAGNNVEQNALAKYALKTPTSTTPPSSTTGLVKV